MSAIERPTGVSPVGVVLSLLEELYVDLHAHPELSGDEVRTASVVADRLRLLGADVTERVGGTGVVGVVENGAGPVVMIRAELDALPVQEQTCLPYASTVAGVMHACGHDLHLAGVLGAAELLVGAERTWRGTLVIVAQPAEETLSGAERMLTDGLYSRFPAPEVALAQHVVALPVGVVAHGPATTWSSAQFRAQLRAEPVHSALGEHGADLVDRLTDLAAAVRVATVEHGAVGGLYAVHTGTCANVTPATARALGSVRAPESTTVDAVLDDLRSSQAVAGAAADATGRSHRVETVLTLTGSAPSVAVDGQLMVDLVAEHIRGFGRGRVWTDYVSHAADDFSRFGTQPRPDGSRVRLGYWMFGGIDPSTWRAARDDGSLVPGNHSDRFAPALTALRAAVVAMTTAAQSQLASHRDAEPEGTTS